MVSGGKHEFFLGLELEVGILLLHLPGPAIAQQQPDGLLFDSLQGNRLFWVFGIAHFVFVYDEGSLVWIHNQIAGFELHKDVLHLEYLSLYYRSRKQHRFLFFILLFVLLLLLYEIYRLLALAQLETIPASVISYAPICPSFNQGSNALQV